MHEGEAIAACPSNQPTQRGGAEHWRRPRKRRDGQFEAVAATINIELVRRDFARPTIYFDSAIGHLSASAGGQDARILVVCTDTGLDEVANPLVRKGILTRSTQLRAPGLNKTSKSDILSRCASILVPYPANGRDEKVSIRDHRRGFRR